eukprot:CAMPEP_0197316312 /NCGR_PEP_ID=MMETSP0891-20130614/42179_1 /TAXON_ID=44058 ORGANISM="Aureoumbra lagunensis, Strain CCMP1510" /NCGR_SAMPLE_ID=MMETSP0891 /ASSEMBLY_ACC=CAM_ASM_000534 /LENGTH=325 /DNA_ID=CAMNT_0042805717 /DNA_START=83 /DNA_END=1060 /DNA_ORIENTATION=+
MTLGAQFCRRTLLKGSLVSAGLPNIAHAGRVEEIIDSLRESDLGVSSAVQESDLGVAIRRRIVRGAQLADALDARWDAFSFYLRKKEPKQNVPTPIFLDEQFAFHVRQAANAAAAATCNETLDEIYRSIDEAKRYYAPVFHVSQDTLSDIANRTVFALETYAAFRVYNTLGVKPDSFEADYGKRLLNFLMPNKISTSISSTAAAADGAERILLTLVNVGYAANLDFRRRLVTDEFDTEDYSVDYDQISITLTAPAELKARLKLETQARRLKLQLLPDLATTLLRAFFIQRCNRSNVKLEEYFVDNEYRTAFDSDQYTDLQLEVLL